MNLSRLRLPAVAPLLLNGYALVANAGLSAVLGIVFWMAATRLYSQENVGLAAALITSMTTISYFAQMNLSSFLTRFLPASGSGAGPLIAKTYGISGAASILVATVFALGIGHFAEPLDFIRDNPAALVFFVVATVFWSLFALQDAALSGLRRSALVPVENTAYAVLKIALLIGLGLAAFSTPLGIFLAWSIPLVPVVIVTNLIIWKGLPDAREENGRRGPGLGRAAQFVGWDFLGSLALGSGFGLATLVVTARAGAEATAVYQLAWSFTYSIYLLGRAMSVSLVAEGANQPVRLRRLTADSLAHSLFLVLGAVVVIMLFAPWIMGLFGPDYVKEGAPVLRVLVLSCLPWAVTTIFCAVARVQHQTRSVAVVQIGTLVVLAAVSAMLVGDHGAIGVAFGWLVAHTVVLAGIVLRTVVREGWFGPIDWLLALAGSAMRMVQSLPAATLPFASRRQEQPLPPEILAVIGRTPLRTMTMLRLDGSLTDSNVILFRSEGILRAVLKYSGTGRGIAELERNASVLKSLAEHEEIRGFSAMLPVIMAEERWDKGYCTVETAVSGTEGRSLLREGRNLSSAMASAVRTLSELHRLTARTGILDEDWAKGWIDGPTDTIRRVVRRGGPGAAPSLDRLRADLRAVFVGREARIGLGHGDAWLGNMFFVSGEGGTGATQTSGLIDWGGSRPDALAAVDACHLALTLRMERRGEEMGTVVSDLLQGGAWSPDEMDCFNAGGLAADFGAGPDQGLPRGILVLTWLSHVSTVIAKSDRARLNLFWSIVNVDRVLRAIDRASSRAGR